MGWRETGSGLLVPDDGASSVEGYGECQVCGCTNEEPCVREDDDGFAQACGWTDDSHTLCTHCGGESFEVVP